MYHGTTEKFSQFKKEYLASGGAYGSGFYFTNSYSLAKVYSDGGEPIAAYLTLRKPWIVDLDRPYDERRIARTPFRKKNVRGWLMSQGYDGVLVRQDLYLEAIAYEPEQIEIIPKGGRRR
jgi:hypothetical protein